MLDKSIHGQVQEFLDGFGKLLAEGDIDFDALDGYRTGVVSTGALEADQIISFVQGACATIITPLAMILLAQCCLCYRSRLQRAPPQPASAASLVLTAIAPQLSDSPSKPARSASIVQLALSTNSRALHEDAAS